MTLDQDCCILSGSITERKDINQVEEAVKASSQEKKSPRLTVAPELVQEVILPFKESAGTPCCG